MMGEASRFRFRRLCAAFAFASVLCFSCTAAKVSPDSADNYLFSTPLYPKKISGVVMGSPPAYYVPRSEDADWLSEAIAERQALRLGHMPSPNTVLYPEFGTWVMSETNRFYRWTTAVDAFGNTNVVVGFHLVTNSPPMGIMANSVGNAYSVLRARLIGGLFLFGEYLDGDEPISEEPRVAFDWGQPSAFTNVLSALVTSNFIARSFSVITMPMTNGTTSVYTNSWSFTSNLFAKVEVTNVTQAAYIDFCHPGEGPFPSFTNYNYVALAASPAAQPGVIAAMYETLGRFVRMYDAPTMTNRAPMTLSWDLDGSSSTNSPGPSYAYYWFSMSNEKSYSWNSETETYDEYLYPAASVTRTPEFISILPTRFDSNLVTTGGAERVEIEAAFAVLEFKYRFDRQTGDAPHLSWENVQYLDKAVVIPLGSYELDLSGEVALAKVNLDAQALCGTAATAAGVDSPPATPWPAAGESHMWEAKCSRVVLIYKINPTSQMEQTEGSLL